MSPQIKSLRALLRKYALAPPLPVIWAISRHLQDDAPSPYPKPLQDEVQS
ncbi:hypothetical protein [Cupriavidus sp. AcVe19-6a]|nr:hypothetical protein [Cupriavidus sp. AcVe19-6a]MBP0640150.1 hypothetical protein [Cupriavidus sp. AcVe19-6a]